MSPRPPGIKAEDVPGPSQREFEAFMKKLVNVPKADIDRREAKYKKARKKRRK